MDEEKKRYRVYCDKIEHYISKEIEATDKEEAQEIYLEMIEQGEVEINESDLSEIWVDDLD